VRRFVRFVRLALIVTMLLAVAAVAEIAVYSVRSNDGPADAAVVLGAAVFGREPSPVFAERIRHAVDLYKAGKVRRIVMTGGLGGGDRVTEAEAARNWAVREGVPASDIVVENRSTTTFENLENAKPLLRENGLDSILVVSDPPHMRRSMMIAGRLGLNAEPSPTPTTRYVAWDSWLKFAIREAYFAQRCRWTTNC
jgi:uncharacterized SAM-binding protein YcdF (DUF218 family)